MDKYKHHFHISSFIHNSYNELVAANTLRMFAISMISLFVPIFLLKSGFELSHIIILEIFMLLGSVYLHFLSLDILKWIGVKKTMILSYASTILFYIILYNTENIVNAIGNIPYFMLVGTTNVMFTTFYWMSYHFYFLKATKESKHPGKRLGILVSVPVMLSIISPFVGSALITNYSFKITFLISIILLIIGSIVLLFSNDIKLDKYNIDKNKIIDIHNMKKNMCYAIEGVNHVGTGFTWPVLLFFSSIQLMSMGVLYLISNTLYAIVSYKTGKSTDKKKSSTYVEIGSLGHGASLIFRALSKTILSMTTFQSIGGLFGGVWTVAIHSIFYKHSKKDMCNSVMNREIYLHIGRIFGFIFLMYAIFISNILTGLISTMILAGVSTFMLVFFVEKEKDAHK